MPINLAGGYGAGGVHDALLEIVKQRMLEQELEQRRQEQEFQRLRQSRMDAKASEQETYNRSRDTAADARLAAQDKLAAEGRTAADEDKRRTLLTGLPAAEQRSILGSDESTGKLVQAPPNPAIPGGMPSYLIGQNPQINPITVRGMKIHPQSMEDLDQAATLDEQRKEESAIRVAQASHVPRTVATGSFEDYVTRTYGSDPTPQQLIKARRDFGTADDRAAPVLKIQTVDAAGNPITRVMTREEAAGQEFAASPTVDQRNRVAAVGRSSTVLQSINELSERINTGQGVMAKVQGEAAKAAAKANLDDDVAEYQALVQMFTPLLARAVGHTGVLTEQDVASVRSGLPQPGDSKSVRDRKMARIDKIMGGMGGPAAKEETPAGAKKPTAAELLKKYGG